MIPLLSTSEEILYSLISGSNLLDRIEKNYKKNTVNSLFETLYRLPRAQPKHPNFDLAFRCLLTYILLKTKIPLPDNADIDKNALFDQPHPDVGAFRILSDHGSNTLVKGSRTNLYCHPCDIQRYRNAKSYAFAWFVLNDPRHWPEKQHSLYVSGPFGVVLPDEIPTWPNDHWLDSLNNTWSILGTHTVICRIQPRDKNGLFIGPPIYCSTQQTVAEAQQVVAGLIHSSRESGELSQFPDAIRGALEKYRSSLAEVGRKKPMTPAVHATHEKMLADITQEIASIRALESFIREKGWQIWPVDAWLSTATQPIDKGQLQQALRERACSICGRNPQQTEETASLPATHLRILLVGEQKDRRYRWKLLDWTELRAVNGILEGNDIKRMLNWPFQATIAEAVKQWDDRNRYPKGWLGLVIPRYIHTVAPDLLQANPDGNYWEWETTGETDLDVVTKWLGYAGIATLLVAALPASTVIGSVLAVAGSAVTVAGGAIGIYQNYSDGVDKFSAYALDTLQMMGGLLRMMTTARSVIKAAKGVTLVNGSSIRDPLHITLTGSDWIQEAIVGKELFEQCKAHAIFEDEQKTPADVIEALSHCLGAYIAQQTIGVVVGRGVQSLSRAKVAPGKGPSPKTPSQGSPHSDKEAITTSRPHQPENTKPPLVVETTTQAKSSQVVKSPRQKKKPVQIQKFGKPVKDSSLVNFNNESSKDFLGKSAYTDFDKQVYGPPELLKRFSVSKRKSSDDSITTTIAGPVGPSLKRKECPNFNGQKNNLFRAEEIEIDPTFLKKHGVDPTDSDKLLKEYGIKKTAQGKLVLDSDQWDYLHGWGPGFGAEFAAGMTLGRKSFNLELQNEGIEKYIRNKVKLGESVDLEITTNSWPIQGALSQKAEFIKEIHYRIKSTTQEGNKVEQITVFFDNPLLLKHKIEVSVAPD